jgi:hypothetical protein
VAGAGREACRGCALVCCCRSRILETGVGSNGSFDGPPRANGAAFDDPDVRCVAVGRVGAAVVAGGAVITAGVTFLLAGEYKLLSDKLVLAAVVGVLWIQVQMGQREGVPQRRVPVVEHGLLLHQTLPTKNRPPRGWTLNWT